MSSSTSLESQEGSTSASAPAPVPAPASTSPAHDAESSAHPASPESPPRKRKKMARTRTGCLNCRRRKRKCDEIHPRCTACTRRQEPCEWGVKLTFRAENSQSILEDHPSMRRAVKRPRTYEILDVRDEVIRDYHLHMPSPDTVSDDDSDGAAACEKPTKSAKSAKRRCTPPAHKTQEPTPTPASAPATAPAPVQSLPEIQPQSLPQPQPQQPQQRTPQQRYQLPALQSPDSNNSLLNHQPVEPSYTLPPMTTAPHAHAYSSHSHSNVHNHPHSHPLPHSHTHHTPYGFPSPANRSPASHMSAEDRPPAPLSFTGSHDLPAITGSASAPASTVGCASGSQPRNSAPLSAQQRLTESAVANLLYLSRGGPSPPVSHVASSTASDVPPHQHAARMGLTPPASMDSDALREPQVFTTDSYRDDGIFVPGSTYLELHRTLRDHLFRESRVNLPRRQHSPAVTPQPRKKLPCGPSEIMDSDDSAVYMARSEPCDAKTLAADTPAFILPADEEVLLWKNWVEEIAPWMDEFDCDHSFRHVLPSMARTHDYLKSAMLALSARQLEQKTGVSQGRSLALYQDAVRGIVPHLATHSTAVVASCVILSVVETMSCNPKTGRRHLDGCASLMQAAGITGFVGGVEQALFWTFARMDMCGGLVASMRPLIPVHHWASKIDLDADVALFRSSTSTRGFTEWANYAVYLVAQVLDLLAVPTLTDGGATVGTCFSELLPRNDVDFRMRWEKLWAYIEAWRSSRPAALQPLICVATSGAHPFPTIVYSNAAAISGNQMYHTAALLMLQHKPTSARLAPKVRSALWHARQICGIGMSNGHHGAWTNSVQALWIAGRCMSHPTEHKAILDLLGRIEEECGWATAWRAADLKELWGDLTE